MRVTSVIVVLGAAAGAWAAALPDAAEILARVDRAEGYETVTMEMAQTITTSSGDERTMRISGWGVNNGEKQLSTYLSPARVKGAKILMLEEGDDIWYHSPSTRRTRKIASHARKKRVMGSDFTYEDSAGGKYAEKYTGTTLRAEVEQGEECWLLELKPTPNGPSYDKILAWVAKSDSIVRRVDFFQDGESEPFKRLVTDEVARFGGRLYPKKMTMTNLEDGGRTVNVIETLDFDTAVPDDTFNPRRLERR